MPTKDKVESSEQPEKRKPGRPPMKLDEAQIEKLAAQGLNETQICKCLGINWRTLQKRKRESESFAQMLQRGRAKGVAKITNALFNNALTGNFQAQAYYLNNRDPDNWTPKQERTTDDTLEALTKLVSMLGENLPG